MRGRAFGDVPDDAGVGDVTFAFRVGGDHFAFAIAGGKEDQAFVEKRPRRAGVALSTDFPYFFAGDGIVAINGLGTEAEHFRLAVHIDDERGRKTFAKIAAAHGLAVAAKIVPRRGAVGFPDGAAGFFVEAGEVLEVNAVECEDEQVVGK